VQCWENAVNLAMQYQKHRIFDIVALAATKLQEVGRFEAAGELHESITDPQGEGGREGGRGRQEGQCTCSREVATVPVQTHWD
jgi:hypothetical protein